MRWFPRGIGISRAGKIDNWRIEHDHLRWAESDIIGIKKCQINKYFIRCQNKLIAKWTYLEGWKHQWIAAADLIN